MDLSQINGPKMRAAYLGNTRLLEAIDELDRHAAKGDYEICIPLLKQIAAVMLPLVDKLRQEARAAVEAGEEEPSREVELQLEARSDHALAKVLAMWNDVRRSRGQPEVE
jgi:hypothetical protein